jgi:two-component system response regulator DesR
MRHDLPRPAALWDQGWFAGLYANAHNAMTPLTEREMAIVREVVAGKSNEQIGQALGKTTGTVRVQLTTIYHKTGARSRVELATKAAREGWV